MRLMRCARSSAWARSAVFAGALTIAAVGLAPGAAAQEKYDRLIVFGDSYADLTLSDDPASNPLAPPGLGLSLWRVYPVPLKENLGIPQVLDVAVGGATASPDLGPPGIPPNLNLPQQVEAFLATNAPFGPRDLITINIGGNDIRAILGNTPAENLAGGYPGELITPLNATSFADTTTAYAVGQIDLLVKAGARNLVLGGFSSISELPELQAQLALLDPALAQIVADSADTYSLAYFEGLQTALVPYSDAGARFFLLDLARLAKAVQADPAKYGFSGGFICPQNGLPAPLSAVCGATADNTTNLNPDQELYYFGPDGLHLTNGGFKLVADYMANIAMAPDTIAVQPGLVTTATGGFTASLLGRLDATRTARAAGVSFAPPDGGRMDLGAADRAPQAPGRTAAFAMGSFLGGGRSEGADAPGYDYDATSGTAGLEFALSRTLVLGLAANYTSTTADLNNGTDIALDAIQGAAYLSYTDGQAFADLLAAYGSHDVGLVRDGILDPVRSDTDASAFALATRGGYLFDLGLLRAGPIAGLTYIRSRVHGYTEDGDPLLTFKVAGQTLDTLAGNAGIRFVAPFRTSGGSLVTPHLNILLEHQLGDETRTLTATLQQAPLLPIHTDFANFGSRTYGRIEGGVTFELGPETGATVNAASTFARQDGEDIRVSAGLTFRF